MCEPDSKPPEFTATFHYFGNLQKLLKRKYRAEAVAYHFRGHPGIKDAIETMGVPHTEVEAILANGCPVDFKYQLQHLDTLEVYSPFSSIPVKNLVPLRSSHFYPVSFILDVHLGKLARRLRLLGFDSFYRNDLGDAEILQLSFEQGRIILTCDRGILKHRRVVHGCLVRSAQVDEQVREVLARYQLYDQVRPWLRCLACNGLLKGVEKELIEDRLELKTRLYYADFHRCRACDRLYWRGSHFQRINRWLAAISPAFGSP